MPILIGGAGMLEDYHSGNGDQCIVVNAVVILPNAVLQCTVQSMEQHRAGGPACQ